MTRSITRLLAAGSLIAVGGVSFAMPQPAQTVRLSAKALVADGVGGIELSVGLAPDDGNHATCGSAGTLSVVIGDAVNYCYTVTNTSATTLGFHTLTDSVDGTIFTLMPHALASGESFQFNRTQVVRADSGIHETTWTAQDVEPGYTAQAGQFGFIDISHGNGTALGLADDGAAAIILPFDFPFYGSSTNAISIGNYGGIIVGPTGQTIPSFEFPLPYVNPFGPMDGGLILPFWDDLGATSGDVYWTTIGDAPPRHAVIQWNRPHFNFDDGVHLAQFEVLLGEDGTISFEYQSTFFGSPDDTDWDNAGSATIGLQNADGSIGNQYSFDTPALSPPQAIDWVVANPQILSASASTQIVPLQPASLAVTPDPLSASADAGGTSVSLPITIANAGDVAMSWSLVEAHGGAAANVARAGTASRTSPATTDMPGTQRDNRESYHRSAPTAVPMRASETAGCDAGTPGILIHDDGTVEDGYTEMPFDVTYARVAYVERFTPDSYPALVASACVAFVSTGPTTQDFELIVLDDSGFDGGPGNEIGAVHATAENIPLNGTSFVRVELSDYGISVPGGSFYVGVRFDPSNPGGIFIAADVDGAPSPDGYQSQAIAWPGPMDSWDSLIDPEIGHPDYHSLLVRPVVQTDDCATPADVPWLSLSTESGSVAAHADATITAMFDPSTLQPGDYSATLCFASNDPTRPHVAVPVAFSVGGRIFADGFDGASTNP